ncbi:MAG: PAS domain S-box protein, partial [Desulfobulbaceae bacterium]
MTGRELDGYWKTVVNTLRDGIMIVNTRGAIVSVNRAFEQITGYTREELIGRSCEILHCESCARARAEGAESWCSLYQTEMTEQRRCQIRRKDGRTIQAMKNAAILK